MINCYLLQYTRHTSLQLHSAVIKPDKNISPMRQIIISSSNISISSSSIKETSSDVAQRRIADAYLMTCRSDSDFFALTRSYLRIRRLTTAATVHVPWIAHTYHSVLQGVSTDMDAGHFFWTRPDPTHVLEPMSDPWPDPTQSFYAVPKSKNCNAIFNRLITNFLQL